MSVLDAILSESDTKKVVEPIGVSMMLHPAELIDTYVSIMESAKMLHEVCNAILTGTCKGNAREYGEQVKMLRKLASSVGDKVGKL